MKITRENTGELTATVRIELDPEDYQEKVNKVLKDLQHKANIPGFRPGKVPFGLMRKMYGKAVMAEEINKILSESLTSYIRDEKLDILGHPLANTEKTVITDFSTQGNYDFYFDLGFAPDFDVDLEKMPEMEHYSIIVNDEMTGRYIDETRRRYGNTIRPELSSKEDMISGEIVELDGEGNPDSKGIKKNVFLNLTQLESSPALEKLTGLAKEGKLRFVPATLFGNAEDAARHLGIDADQAGRTDLNVELEIKDIYHVDPAPMDAEFFEKVYPGRDITTEEAFREQVKKDASGSFAPETDKLFFRQVSDKLIELNPVALPDDYLKRWLLEQKESKMTPETIDNQYDSFAGSTRWQLIENKLFLKHNITVKEEDIRQYIKDYFLRQIPLKEDDPERDKRYDSLVDTVMENKEQVSKINDELYTNRLMDLFKTNLKIEEKTISYEDFIKLASTLYEHEHEHEHDHEHEHEHEHEHDSEHQHEH